MERVVFCLEIARMNNEEKKSTAAMTTSSSTTTEPPTTTKTQKNQKKSKTHLKKTHKTKTTEGNSMKDEMVSEKCFCSPLFPTSNMIEYELMENIHS